MFRSYLYRFSKFRNDIEFNSISHLNRILPSLLHQPLANIVKAYQFIWIFLKMNIRFYLELIAAFIPNIIPDALNEFWIVPIILLAHFDAESFEQTIEYIEVRAVSEMVVPSVIPIFSEVQEQMVVQVFLLGICEHRIGHCIRHK